LFLHSISLNFVRAMMSSWMYLRPPGAGFQAALTAPSTIWPPAP